MDEASLVQLLHNILAEDNEVRKAAEAQFGELSNSNPTWLMHALTEVCATTQETGVSTVCLILLRKMISSDAGKQTAFTEADEATREAIKARLLQVLTATADGPQRGSAAVCVAAVAVAVYGMKQNWDELWHNVFTILCSPESPVSLKTVCCEIVSATMTVMHPFHEVHMNDLIMGLKNCFQSTTADATACTTLWCAAINVIRMIASLCDQARTAELTSLTPLMMNVLEQCLANKLFDNAAELLSELTACIEEATWIVRSHTLPFLTAMMQMAASNDIEPATRHIAVEVLLSYCEGDAKGARSVPQFATSFFELLFQYLLNPVFGEEWDNCGEDDDDEYDRNGDFVTGRTGIDRLSCALGGRKLQNTAQRLFASNISSTDWRARNAAIVLILYCSEGMMTVFSSALPSLVETIASHTKDESKYVRYSALGCLSQLCSDFGEQVQPLYQVIFDSAIPLVCDPVPAVASAAASLIDSYCDNALDSEEATPEEVSTLEPYVSPVCEMCIKSLKSTHVAKLQENVLSALASLTNVCKQMMQPLTNELAPVYIQVLNAPDSDEIMPVKCKAIECLTLLACGIGRDAFAQYTEFTCNYLVSLCAQGFTSGDVRSRFVLRGWTCMVECLKEQSLVFLSGLMPVLLELVNTECEVVIVPAAEASSEEDEGEDERNGISRYHFAVPGVGEKVAKFHTGVIEEKETAANVLYAIMSELGVLMAPYYPQIAASAIKLVSFSVSQGIRESGCAMLTSVLEGYRKLNDTASLQQVSTSIAPELFQALSTEEDEGIMADMIEAMSICISVNPQCATQKIVEDMGQKLFATLNVFWTKRVKVCKKMEEEQDEDELDELQDKLEGVELLLYSCCNAVGTLLKHTPSLFGAFFVQQLLPVVLQWVADKKDKFTLSRAFSLLSDFIEHVPELLDQSVLPGLVFEALAVCGAHTDADLLQTAYYCLNVSFSRYTAQLTTQVDAAVHVCRQYLAFPQAAQREYTDCTCNVVSLVTVLVEVYGLQEGPLTASASDLCSLVVSKLPVSGDNVEARRVHDRVLGWCSKGVPAMQPLASEVVNRLRQAQPETLSDESKKLVQ